MSRRQRFCNIKTCINSNGSKDRDYQFFRIPLSGTTREQWICNIKEHQHFEESFAYFQVCNLHFKPDSFKTNKKLIKGAIPTIFRSESLNSPEEEVFKPISQSFEQDVSINESEDYSIEYLESTDENSLILPNGTIADCAAGLSEVGSQTDTQSFSHGVGSFTIKPKTGPSKSLPVGGNEISSTSLESFEQAILTLNETEDYSIEYLQSSDENSLILADSTTGDCATGFSEISSLIKTVPSKSKLVGDKKTNNSGETASLLSTSERHFTHQDRIFELEIELYKAKHHIFMLEARIAAKNKVIAQLKSSNHHYKREKEKWLGNESEKASNYSKLSVC